MRSLRRSAAAVLLVATLASGAAAQDSTATSPALSTLRSLVVPLLAKRWNVSADRLIVRFGALRPGWTPERGARADLLGAGRGGWWVLRVHAAGETDESVRLQAGVRIPIEVAAHTLPRGRALEASDMRAAERVHWGEPVEGDPIAKVGWVTRRIVRTGEELRQPTVQPPVLVQSGRPVTVVWRRDGVGLRVGGEAAGSASLGEHVYVRTQSGIRLRGIVVGPGVVNVTTGGGEE